jgi:NDP-sugar pyrophosphorylase family protein
MTAPGLTNWPALVLTAGLATRLRPLSNVRAKAALPVAGQPLIGRILTWLQRSGVRQAVLNLHHLPETVTQIVGDGTPWGLQVRYSWESKVLGSAGGPRRALDLLGTNRFILVNGDTLTDCDIAAVARQHIETGARVTMAVVPRNVARAVVADGHDIVTGFGAGNEHFIGVQVVEADVFGGIPLDTPYETVKTLYPQLVAAQPGSVRVYRSNAEFLDVGTPADYLETVDAIARREHRELDRGRAVRVHPTAEVRRSVLWDRVQVDERARLEDCIVGDDVVVPAGTHYERCVLIKGDDGLLVTRF